MSKADDQLQREADQLDDPEAVLLVLREVLAKLAPEALARLWYKTSARLAWRFHVPDRMVEWEKLSKASQRHRVATAVEVLAELRGGQ